MHAARIADLNDSRAVATDRAAAGFIYMLGGLMMAAVVTLGVLFADGFLIGLVQHLLHVQVCEDGFRPATVIALALCAPAVSIAGFFWLRAMRNWIGHEGDPSFETHGRYYRRRFAHGAQWAYCLAAPVTWIFMLLAANCAAR